jgi:hypothetical protein
MNPLHHCSVGCSLRSVASRCTDSRPSFALISLHRLHRQQTFLRPYWISSSSSSFYYWRMLLMQQHAV